MKIGIIGCGNMGQALLKGIIARRLISKRNILASDKDKRRLNSARLKFGIGIVSLNSALFKRSDLIILAVKPQDLDTVLKDAPRPLKGKLLISICAGMTTGKLEQALGRVAVVRVMPNIPAQIGEGISAMSLGRYAKARDKKLAESVFSCIGEVVEVKEHLMDAVTAISGSGPAYFFYLAELLIAAAKGLAIPSGIARRLTIKTALGSALLMSQSKAAPEVLRKRVTSKGGTTAAAFKILRKKGLDRALVLAVKAAAKRSKQVAGGKIKR